MISTAQLTSAALGLALLTAGALSGCDRSERVTQDSAPAGEVPFNTRISFGQGGGSERYKGTGWSKAEEKFTWTEGTSAQLRLPMAATNDPITLKMRIAALIHPPDLPFQPVEVLVNDQKIADWQVGDTAEFAAAIPPEIAKLGGVLTITFKIPKATSPEALGQSADARVLGICCFDLELAKG